MELSQKTKILFVLNRLVIGGQAIDTIPLIYHLKDEFDILVLHGRKEPDEEEALFLLEQYPGINTKKIKYFKRSINPFFDLLAYFIISKEIKKFKADIVHTHGFKPGLLGRIAAKNAGVPCIIHTFHGHLFHSYYNKFLSRMIMRVEKKLGSITTYIIAISNTQKNEFVNGYKLFNEEKVLVINLGVDENVFLSDYADNRISFRKKYLLKENDIAVGIIGRVVPVKNYELFVKVVGNFFKQNNTRVKFFVIGDGILLKWIREQLDKMNISWCNDNAPVASAYVVFTSWIPQISKAVPGLDIIILTSHNEGTPLSLIEAQICSKPVVATNVGGVKDTFIDGETGFLSNPGNDIEFSEKLSALVNDKSLREIMGTKAGIFAAQTFSKQKEITSFRTLYRSCKKSE